ncbi:hypothetical protein H0H93_006045 [Arthromyces matolae]|nr:hypothetical protein H0H93_006045 [Arthromyces matolae]
MSPTFIRLKHFVLASLIASAAIHLSPSFAAAAPTPFTNDLLPWGSLLPSINSDFGLLKTSSNDDIHCGPDKFHPRCEGPALKRRNNDDIISTPHTIDGLRKKFQKLPKDLEHMEECIQILLDQEKLSLEIIWKWRGADEQKTLSQPVMDALDARLEYSQFVSGLSFKSYIKKGITALRLQRILESVGMLEPSHAVNLTPVVFDWLNMPKNDYPPTVKAYVVANELQILTMALGGRPLFPQLTEPNDKEVAKEYIPRYCALLMDQKYVPWPADEDIDKAIQRHESHAPTAPPSREHLVDLISAILLRYTQWERSESKDKGKRLEALEKHFRSEFESQTLPMQVKVVIAAYLTIFVKLKEEHKYS